MSKPAFEQLEKLPKWAREHINDLTRQREQAVRALNQYCDSQTPSPFSIPELECTGEEQGPSHKVRFVQTHKMEVHHAGVELSIILREGCIDLQWNGEGNAIGEIGFIPKSFQSAYLKTAENMRK